MFDIASTELLIIAVVALVVIGPKDLPAVMRTVGQWVARARGMAKHFRAGMDTMIRESELEEMEKKWKAENERIMREHPAAPAPADGAGGDWGAAPPEPPPRAAAESSPPPPDRAPPPRPLGPPRAAAESSPPPDRAPPPSEAP